MNFRLGAVAFFGLAHGYAAGFNSVMRTTNGGTTWEDQSNRVTGMQLENTDIYGIACTDSLNAVMVGEAPFITRTTDGGLHWTALDNGTGEHLRSVRFPTASMGFAVGGNGKILRTLDGGASWSQVPSGTTELLYDVWFADPMHGVAVGPASWIYRTTDGGSTWNPVSGGHSYALLGVTFGDALHGIAVGLYGEITRTTDGGASWQRCTSGTGADLFAVSMGSSTTGTAVGSGGVVLRTTDAGASWSRQESGTDNFLFDVWSSGPEVATIVGEYGTILRTVDGGERRPTGTALSDDVIPELFRLAPNYPNPFNSSTTFVAHLPRTTRAHLAVYDLLGRCLATLADGPHLGGELRVSWHADRTPSGVYIVKATAGAWSRSRTMLLIR